MRSNPTGSTGVFMREICRYVSFIFLASERVLAQALREKLHRYEWTWRSLWNGKFGDPIFKNCLVFRVDSRQNDYHSDLCSAIYHVAESWLS